MFWMMLLMFLPLPGLALFFLTPLSVAIPLYIFLLAVSGSYHCLMMRSMRYPLRMGPEKMPGSIAFVRHWKGNNGQVAWNGEIWQARASDGSEFFSHDDKVVVDRRAGLTLLVRRANPPNRTGWGIGLEISFTKSSTTRDALRRRDGLRGFPV